jgi:hypothetical protein
MSKKDSSRPECANCGTVDLPLNMCSQCKAAAYCGKPCQVQHWKKGGHKERCVPIEARKPSAEVRPSGAACAICLAALDDPCTLPCGHTYHKACVEELRKVGVKQACPSCRADLPPGAEKQFDGVQYIVIRERDWTLPSTKRELVLPIIIGAADQGNADAQVMLGSIYMDGKGVPQNYAEALRWFHKSAAQGNARAQNDIGFMYTYGKGVKEDYEEAVKWYGKAADQGFSTAQYLLGIMYFTGKGVPQSDQIALELFMKAASQGDYGAQYTLGLMYEHGKGVRQSYATAVQWYRKAVAQGNQRAKLRLMRCMPYV